MPVQTRSKTAAAKPAPVIKPAPVAKPAPVVKPAPFAKPAPIEEDDYEEDDYEEDPPPLVAFISKDLKSIRLERNGQEIGSCIGCVDDFKYFPHLDSLRIDYVEKIQRTIYIPGGFFSSPKTSVSVFDRISSTHFDTSDGIIIHYNGSTYDNFVDFHSVAKYSYFN